MNKTHWCKWVFKRKTDIKDNVKTYKVRLVTEGYKQWENIDFDETLSSIVMLKPIRILFVILAYHDYDILKIDVKTAFLNGNLHEDVYMTTWRFWI